MIELTEQQKRDYFRRSYQAVDGLWFMKAEERLGFEAALELDLAVWKVLPKIQARTIKAMAGLSEDMDGLYEGLAARLCLEGFDFSCEKTAEGIRVEIRGCPWQDLIAKSGRHHISDRVGDLICAAENAVWAEEFGAVGFERESRICGGDAKCSLVFFLEKRD